MPEIKATDTYNSGDIIFREGDAANAMYVICSGTVEITKEKDGKKISLAKLSKGSIFGEMALIDRAPRSATVTAIEETTCYKVNSQDFDVKFNTADPAIKGIFRILVQTLRGMNERVQGTNQ